MGLCRPLCDAHDRHGAPAVSSAARSLQWPALDGTLRGAVADDAERPATGEAVHQQTQRWLRAGVFEAIVHDVRVVLRLADGRPEQPSAAILDSRTRQSTPVSGPRAGYDGAKRTRGRKVQMQSRHSAI